MVAFLGLFWSHPCCQKNMSLVDYHIRKCSRRIRWTSIPEPRGIPRPYWLILSGKVHGKSCQKFMQVLHDTPAHPISPWGQLVKVPWALQPLIEAWSTKNRIVSAKCGWKTVHSQRRHPEYSGIVRVLCSMNTLMQPRLHTGMTARHVF